MPVWFPGARLNYAENLLSRNDDAIACTAARETGQISHHSWRELRAMVRQMAAAMRVNGLAVGDRIAGESLSLVDLRGIFEINFCYTKQS